MMDGMDTDPSTQPPVAPSESASRRVSPLRQGLIFGTVVGVAIAVVMGVMMSQSVRGEMIDDPVVELPPLASLPVTGKAAQAPLIRVVYDYKCPVCATFEKKVMPELLGGVVARGEARLQAVPYPFLSRAFGLETDDSLLGAQAGLCVNKVAGSEVFFRFTQAMFAAQGDERQVWITSEKVRAVAGTVLPASRITAMESCVSRGETLSAVDESLRALLASGISATPTVIVGNRRVLSASGRPSWAARDIEAAVRAQSAAN